MEFSDEFMVLLYFCLDAGREFASLGSLEVDVFLPHTLLVVGVRQVLYFCWSFLGVRIKKDIVSTPALDSDLAYFSDCGCLPGGCLFFSELSARHNGFLLCLVSCLIGILARRPFPNIYFFA